MELNYGVSFFDLNHLAALFCLVILPVGLLLTFVYFTVRKWKNLTDKKILFFYLPVLILWNGISFMCLVGYSYTFVVEAPCKIFDPDVSSPPNTYQTSRTYRIFISSGTYYLEKSWCPDEEEKYLDFSKRWDEKTRKWEEQKRQLKLKDEEKGN